MSELESKIDQWLEEAQTLRDELAVKANLGVAEAKDELGKLDEQMEDLKSKGKQIANMAGDTAQELRIAAEMGIKSDSKEDLTTALELAGEEIKKGYERIKKLL
ncbi:MAG TPA: hypothetical protein ENL02_01890 [Epsilonproteobacteria bacterium]|nr:hypothetical protein [Campylobacterota bacterium]HHD72658.1 hypothetical protein [Campylobacterota bacterium]